MARIRSQSSSSHPSIFAYSMLAPHSLWLPYPIVTTSLLIVKPSDQCALCVVALLTEPTILTAPARARHSWVRFSECGCRLCQIISDKVWICVQTDYCLMFVYLSLCLWKQYTWNQLLTWLLMPSLQLSIASLHVMVNPLQYGAITGPILWEQHMNWMSYMSS